MVRGFVNCAQCGTQINRVLWNYGKNRPIEYFFCDNKCKGSWQTSQRELLGFTKEWLINEYQVLGKSANQIAIEIGRDPKRVWEWIRNYGIETRSRGSVDYGFRFKKGIPCRPAGFKHSNETKEKIRQARLRDGRVPYLKDGKHWLKHEGAKPWAWKGGISPERQAFYSTDEWRKAVKQVWHRDNATCQRCKKHHNETQNRGTFHIHHIVSFENKALRAEVSNLVLLCKECHRWIHGKQNTEKLFIKEAA